MLMSGVCLNLGFLNHSWMAKCCYWLIEMSYYSMQWEGLIFAVCKNKITTKFAAACVRQRRGKEEGITNDCISTIIVVIKLACFKATEGLKIFSGKQVVYTRDRSVSITAHWKVFKLPRACWAVLDGNSAVCVQCWGVQTQQSQGVPIPFPRLHHSRNESSRHTGW